jgi:pimeloyl-ACP methyl ester carboxylesterase
MCIYYICRKLGEKTTVKVIPDTGHLPQQQDIKLFNRILLDFLLEPSSTSNGSAAAR